MTARSAEKRIAMTRRFASLLSALALSISFASHAYAAGPKVNNRTAVPTITNTTAKGKLISFHVRNDSGSALTLQVGDQQMTVEAGKTADLKLQEGTQITTANASGHFNAGDVLTTVSTALSGNTLAVK